MRSPYEILNVPPTASKEEIKKAYRDIAKKTHPDVTGGDEQLADIFKDATAAFQFLMDDYNRQQYAYDTEMENEAAANKMYEEQARSSDSGYTVEQFINQMYAEIKAANKNATITLISGIAAVFLGVAATFVSFMLANPGESYTVFTGLIFFGGIIGVRNLYRFISIKNSIREFEENCWEAILGHKPSKEDMAYKAYKKSKDVKKEHRNTILAVLAFILVLGVIVFMGDTILDGTNTSGSQNANTTPQISEEERLYNELIELNDELLDMEAQIERYEAELTSLADEYEVSGSESTYNEYNELYSVYEDYFDTYESKYKVFAEKYEYFENTYGFDE